MIDSTKQIQVYGGQDVDNVAIVKKVDLGDKIIFHIRARMVTDNYRYKNALLVWDKKLKISSSPAPHRSEYRFGEGHGHETLQKVIWWMTAQKFREEWAKLQDELGFDGSHASLTKRN